MTAQLIDIRTTQYGKIVDVLLDGATLPVSLPYAEYCELEASGKLDEPEELINLHERFMTHIKTMHTWQPEGTEPSPIVAGGEVVEFGSAKWFAAQEEIPF